jgi:basic membrane lipoprotein Med (substrate-binding protein (PBP1-ABC) superfamily)
VLGVGAAVALVAAGCGGRKDAATSPPVAPRQPAAQRVGLRVGVVGPLEVSVPGAIVTHRSLRAARNQSLVLVAASSPAAAEVPAEAAAHPSTHYVIVGASAADQRLPNLAGAVLRDDQAARLGGIAAGLSAEEQTSRSPSVAWVGPRDPAAVAGYVAGVRAVAPGTTILRAWSSPRPASCKESALGAIQSGATAVMAARGLCAAAAVDGAHERNLPGLALSDFELPDVVAASIARNAVRGVFYGREDLIFGAASGAIGVRRLDPLFSDSVSSRTRAAAQQLASGRSATG